MLIPSSPLGVAAQSPLTRALAIAALLLPGALVLVAVVLLAIKFWPSGAMRGWRERRRADRIARGDVFTQTLREERARRCDRG